MFGTGRDLVNRHATALAVSVTASMLGAQAPPAYRSLRYDEDYRYLRDPARAAGALDALKYLPLDEPGTVWLTLGGEERLRYERIRNSQWGSGPQDDDGYLLQRLMLHADLHLGERVRVFTQLKSGIESGRTGGPRPTDEDRLDLHQAFTDVQAEAAGLGTLTARLGRQELQYGSSRLISVREGPNVRQSFDGARLLFAAGAWRADAFVTRPVETEPGVFDDGSDRDRAFWGVYATGPLAPLPDGNVDLYFLGLDRRTATFEQGTAREERRSVGARVFGRPQPFDYDFEAAWQFGRFGDDRIAAWTFASETGVTLGLPWSPRLSLKVDVASGDRDPDVGTLQTFNALFPRGSYFGEPALIGPANLFDVHPALELWPTPAVRAFVDWDVFWRQSRQDALYGSSLTPVRSAAGSRARYVGNQLQAGCEWQVQRHVAITGVWARFFAGTFLEETGPAEDVDYVSVWMTLKF